MVQFARAGRLSLDMRRVSLAELVDNVREDLSNEVAQRNIEWQTAALPELLADAALLRLALVNLLSNALKFTGRRTWLESRSARPSSPPLAKRP